MCKPKGIETLRCKDADGAELFVPVCYTNMGVNTLPDQTPANSATDFSYDSLVELLGILDSIECQVDYVAMS